MTMPAPTPADASCRFDDEVVVVTGAAQGLGRSYAVAFADRGARVALIDLDEALLEEAVTSIRATGATAVGVTADICSPADAIGQIRRDLGPIDVVVNNAGIVLNRPFPETAVADVRRLLEVHAVGAFAVTSAAWEDLVDRRGRVVNVTSGALFGLPGHSAYAMAKGAVFGLTRAMASEGRQVRVNAVMPMARTRMYEAAGGVTASDEDELMTLHFPPDAVGPAVTFLAWSETPCHGEVLEVAGTAVSRIALGSSSNLDASSPEVLAAGWSELEAAQLHEVGSLADSVVRKLTFLAASPSSE